MNKMLITITFMIFASNSYALTYKVGDTVFVYDHTGDALFWWSDKEILYAEASIEKINGDNIRISITDICNKDYRCNRNYDTKKYTVGKYYWVEKWQLKNRNQLQ